MSDLHALAAAARSKANAISPSSPNIRAAALAQCDFDDAVADLLQPPPAGSHIGNGLILFRYGSSWVASGISGYERYGVCVVGYGNDADVAKLTPTVGLGYRTSVEVFAPASGDPQLSLGGVTFATAQANGWLLKDAAGNLITVPGTPGVGNLSLPPYQQAWAQTLAARAKATGLKGFFLDNVVPDPTLWPFSAAPTFAGGLSLADAYVAFLKAVRPLLPGLYLLANCGPGGSAWAQRIAPYVDGLLFEGPQRNLTMATQWLGAVQQQGRDPFWLVTETDPTSAAAHSLAVDFAAGWTVRPHGGLGFDFGQPDPYSTNWAAPVLVG